LDFRPLCWAASRALWDLKTGGNLPGTVPPKFPPIVSRGIFPTLCPIWRPQQPPAAQRNRPFFLVLLLALPPWRACRAQGPGQCHWRLAATGRQSAARCWSSSSEKKRGPNGQIRKSPPFSSSSPKGGRQELRLGPPFKTNMSPPGPGLLVKKQKHATEAGTRTDGEVGLRSFYLSGSGSNCWRTWRGCRLRGRGPNQHMNGKTKKRVLHSPRGCACFFFAFPQGKATRTWQCLWSPLPTPTSPLIYAYHRPGPLTKPTA
jgi:hypothetical protein